MTRREFVQRYVLTFTLKSGAPENGKPSTGLSNTGNWETQKVNLERIVRAANFAYDFIENDEKVAADNSMPDTRQYLDQVTAMGLNNGQ